MSVSVGQPFDLSKNHVHLTPSGAAEFVKATGGGHGRVDGRLVGEAKMKASPPHGGEMHPDGDEFLYLIEGAVDIALDDVDGECVTPLRPGEAFVVPRGVWHRVIVLEPCRLLFATPGRSQVRRRSAVPG